MRTWIAGLLAATVVGGSAAVVVASPAHAEDRRPCVSLREFRGLKEGWTRQETEARLEVVHMGRMVNYFDGIGYVLRYPACGYTRTEGRVRIEFQGSDDTLYAADRHIHTGSTRHGHN